MKVILNDSIYKIFVYCETYNKSITFYDKDNNKKEVKIIQSSDFQFTAEDLLAVLNEIEKEGFKDFISI